MSEPSNRATSLIAAGLPQVDPAAAEFARCVHDLRLHAACRRVASGISLSPVVAVAVGALRRLHLRCDAGDIEVLFAAPDRPGLDLLMGGAGDVPPALAQAAVEVAFGPVADALQALGLAGARAVALRPNDAASPPGGWCAVRLDREDLATFQVAALPARVYEALRCFERSPGPGFASSAALTGSVELSARPVRLSVLNSLAAGDVLLLETRSPASEGGSCGVRFGALGGRRWYAHVHVEDTVITLQGEPRMIDDECESEPDAADDLSAMDVPVRFEVETARVPLRELAAMGSGYVISLATPLASARLRLVACGRVVGHAELVAVGERLGARILRMASSDE